MRWAGSRSCPMVQSAAYPSVTSLGRAWFRTQSVRSSSPRDLISEPSCSRWRSFISGDLVDAAVEALDLGVQCIDEAPEEALAFVGELRTVLSDGAGQDVDRFLDPGKGLFLVPDLAIVELVWTRGPRNDG